MCLSRRAWVEKTVDGEKTHGLTSKEKVPGAVVYKEGHADIFLEHERAHDYWFPWKGWNCKQSFQLLTPLAKFNLFIK